MNPTPQGADSPTPRTKQLEDNFAKGIHSCHDNCQRIECVQRREIDRLRQQLEEARKKLGDLRQLVINAGGDSCGTCEEIIKALTADRAQLSILRKLIS